MNIKPLLLSIILASTPFTVFAEMVNINQASAATLQHYLKGIGQKKAESIVIYRTEHKKFKSLDEIMKVKGIGKGIYKNIKPDLSLKEGKVALVKVTKKVKKVKAVVKNKEKGDVSLKPVKIVKASADVPKIVDVKPIKTDKKEQEKVSKIKVEKKDIK